MRSLRRVTDRWLAHALGFTFAELCGIADSADSFYREREVLVGTKIRRLLVPTHPLRLIQVRLHRRLLRAVEPHPAAYACRGRGPLLAARQHSGNRWFFHADIQDFYPSVRPDFLVDRFRALKAPDEIARLLTALTTTRDQLPQGAPSSPLMGEIALYPLDCRLGNLLVPAGLTYTRYVDDIAVSGGTHLRDRLAGQVVRIIEACGWKLNSKKGGVFGPDQRHKLLGLIVNRGTNTDREAYARVRWLLKLASKGEIVLTGEELASLRGTVGWIAATNPQRGAMLMRILEAAEVTRPGNIGDLSA